MMPHIDPALARLDAAAQVAAVLAAVPRGACPDLPPFLIVTPEAAVRRLAWWEANPPKAVAWNANRNEDPAAKERVAAFKAAEDAKQAARIAALRLHGLAKKAEAVGVDVNANRRWCTRTSRWLYDDVAKAIAAVPPEVAAKAKAVELAHARDLARVRRAGQTGHVNPRKVAAKPKATPAPKADAPPKAAKPPAPVARPAGSPPGLNPPDAITWKMLQAEGGVSQVELAKALGPGVSVDSARGRILKLCKKRNVMLVKDKDPTRGTVYSLGTTQSMGR